MIHALALTIGGSISKRNKNMQWSPHCKNSITLVGASGFCDSVPKSAWEIRLCIFVFAQRHQQSLGYKRHRRIHGAHWRHRPANKAAGSY